MWFIVTGSYVDFPDFAIALVSEGQILPFSSNPVLTDGQWHTIAFTYNGAGVHSLYIDNKFFQTKTSSGYNTQGDEKNSLGTFIDSVGTKNKFVGDLKDIAFYNYTLTALQATTDFITE